VGVGISGIRFVFKRNAKPDPPQFLGCLGGRRTLSGSAIVEITSDDLPQLTERGKKKSRIKHCLNTNILEFSPRKFRFEGFWPGNGMSDRAHQRGFMLSKILVCI